jgi:hypothetical protein
MTSTSTPNSVKAKGGQLRKAEVMILSEWRAGAT